MEDHIASSELENLGGGLVRSGSFTGMRALMMAVLEDGIRSYLSPVARIRAEAECWVVNKRTCSPFSFSVICETLGLAPDAVAEKMRALRSHRFTPREAVRRSRPNVRQPGQLRPRRRRR